MSGQGNGWTLALVLARLRRGWSSKRNAIGLIALVMLVGGATIYIAGVVASSFASVAGPLLRAGLVLGALWLAWPQLAKVIKQVPYWLAVGMACVLFVGILRPWFLFFVVPVALLLWFLGPALARKLGGAPPQRQPPVKPRPRKSDRA